MGTFNGLLRASAGAAVALLLSGVAQPATAGEETSKRSYFASPHAWTPPTKDEEAEQRRASMADYADRHADTLKRRKDYQGALRELNEAIRIDPQAKFYVHRAEIYTLMGRDDEAFKEWEKISRLDSGASDLLYEGAETYQLQGKYDQAIKLCNLSLAIRPTVRAYSLRSAINKAAGHTQEAIADAQLAYRYALEWGSDGQYERKDLKALLGNEPPLPTQPRDKVPAVLATISALADSPKPFSLNLTMKLTGRRLLEIPLRGSPGKHTGSFETQDAGGDKQIWSDVALKVADSDGYSSHLGLTLNSSACYIAAQDIVAHFGPSPIIDEHSTECIVTSPHIDYVRPWGKMSFWFNEGGFKLLRSVQMWVDVEKNHRPKN